MSPVDDPIFMKVSHSRQQLDHQAFHFGREEP